MHVFAFLLVGREWSPVPRHKKQRTCRCRRPLGADMLPHNAMMLTTGDDEASPFTPLGVVNTPYGQTPQVCTVLCDRVMRSNTHNSIPPNPFARNTTCMAVCSDPERPTDTISLAMRVCEGQDPLLRLSFLGAPTFGGINPLSFQS